MVDRLAVLIGAGLLLYGIWQIFVPAAFVLAGCMLLAGALWRKP